MSFTVQRSARVASGVFTLGLALAAHDVGAQDARSAWGAEGRLGGGPSALLTRWFGSAWSLSAGGSYSGDHTTSVAPNAPTRSSSSTSLVAMLRRERAAGDVHPFVAIGPTLLRQSTSSPEFTYQTDLGSPIIISSSESSATGYGARAEVGSFVKVAGAVDLGMLGALTLSRTTANSRTGDSDVRSDYRYTTVGLGNLQFLMRVRF